MKKITRDTVYMNHSASNLPGLVVKPGEEFWAETELCSGGWLHSIDDRFSLEKRGGSNPAVCVAVEGAAPGDVILVHILEILPEELGFTGFDPRAVPSLASEIYPHNWDLSTKTVRIRGGFVEWSDRLRLPVAPMIGTLGTAPMGGEALSNTKAGSYGGNMDAQEVAAGATVWLPVNVTGALLHIGDVHAIQGDGEICSAGGIECRAAVRLKAELRKKPDAMNCVRLENETHIAAIACGRSCEESFRLAARELTGWISADYGCTAEEAYLLLGQVLEARATQFVNPTSTYICKVAKKYL